MNTFGSSMIKVGKAGIAGISKHSVWILLGLNVASAVYMVYKTWTTKDEIESILEEHKDDTLLEKVKAVAPKAGPIVAAAAVNTATSVGLGMVAIKAGKKAVEATGVANGAITAHEEYEKATKEIVGEDKEKEIRDKVAKEEANNKQIINKIQDYSSQGGYDVYYDSTIGKSVTFPFNKDRMLLLEEQINNRKTYIYDDQITMEDVYDMISDITDVEIERPSTGVDLGWRKGTFVHVKSSFAGEYGGRGLFKLEYTPKPTFLYNTADE